MKWTPRQTKLKSGTCLTNKKNAAYISKTLPSAHQPRTEGPSHQTALGSLCFLFASRLGVEEAGSLKMPVSVNRKTRAKSCSSASQETFRQLSSCKHSGTFCNLTAHTNQGQVGSLNSCLCRAAELPATAVVVAETRQAAWTSIPPGCQPALCQAYALGHLFPRTVRPHTSQQASIEGHSESSEEAI